jgi:hypothetical protein
MPWKPWTPPTRSRRSNNRIGPSRRRAQPLASPPRPPYNGRPRHRAVSSAVEHCLHTARVAGSNPAPPTISINETGHPLGWPVSFYGSKYGYSNRDPLASAIVTAPFVARPDLLQLARCASLLDTSLDDRLPRLLAGLFPMAHFGRDLGIGIDAMHIAAICRLRDCEHTRFESTNDTAVTNTGSVATTEQQCLGVLGKYGIRCEYVSRMPVSNRADREHPVCSMDRCRSGRIGRLTVIWCTVIDAHRHCGNTMRSTRRSDLLLPRSRSLRTWIRLRNHGGWKYQDQKQGEERQAQTTRASAESHQFARTG